MFNVQEYWAMNDEWATYSAHNTFAEAEIAMNVAIKFHKHNGFRIVSTK
jgi:hypothetical protein